MATNFVNDTAGNKYQCTIPSFNHKAKLYTAEELADKPKLVDELVELGFGGLKLVEAAKVAAAAPAVSKYAKLTVEQLKAEIATREGLDATECKVKADYIALLDESDKLLESIT